LKKYVDNRRVEVKKHKAYSNYPCPTPIPGKDYEKPSGIDTIRRRAALSHNLPTEALMAGYELIEIVPSYGNDPWYLYDKDGKIVYEWDTLHPPSLAEVREVCQVLINRGG
jgi:hypothetical protein